MITKETSLWCDINGGRCLTHAGDPAPSRAADVRRDARYQGWKRVGNKDICPNCAEDERARRGAAAKKTKKAKKGHEGA